MSELPAAARARLGRRLRQLRNQLNLTGDDVARLLQWSGAKVSRIEASDRKVGWTDLQALLTLYDVTAVEREWLLGLHAVSRQVSPYQPFADISRGSEIALIEAIHDSAAVCEQSGGHLPALLRTPEYAEAALLANGADRVVIDRKLSLLALRQSHFLRPDGPQAAFVMCESAFMRAVGGKPVARRQYLSLLDLPAHIKIHVIPFSAPPMSGLGSTFTLVRSFQPGDDIAGITVCLNALNIERSPQRIEQLSVAFDELLQHATAAEQLPDIVRWALANLGRAHSRPWAAAA